MSLTKDERELWIEVVKTVLESEHMLPSRWPEEFEQTLFGAKLACDIADTVVERLREAKEYY
ncbi:hypothetical protein LCGC14_0526480 [marine sediment metagenome]|uniref:Uncharacterized protein n=1 Tax=marine sediment metagenome TaxID=412755 RepID=A0A0F9SFF8_9ZZZZ